MKIPFLMPDESLAWDMTNILDGVGQAVLHSPDSFAKVRECAQVMFRKHGRGAVYIAVNRKVKQNLKVTYLPLSAEGWNTVSNIVSYEVLKNTILTYSPHTEGVLFLKNKATRIGAHAVFSLMHSHG